MAKTSDREGDMVAQVILGCGAFETCRDVALARKGTDDLGKQGA